MLNCPCGFGKGIPDGQATCPACGTDLTPLHRVRALPKVLFQDGVALMERQEWRRAAEPLLASVSLDDSVGEVHHALGQCMERMDRREDAITHYERALALSPGDEVLQETVARLQRIPNQNAIRFRALQMRLGQVAVAVALIAVASAAILVRRSTPSVNATSSAAEASKAILSRVRQEPSLAGLPVRVLGAGESVVVSGEVPTELHRALLREIASHLPAGVQVDASGVHVIGPRTEAATMARHTVRRGDSLSKIALRYYGDVQRWREVHEANKSSLNNSHALRVGTVLSVPNVVWCGNKEAIERVTADAGSGSVPGDVAPTQAASRPTATHGVSAPSSAGVHHLPVTRP